MNIRNVELPNTMPRSLRSCLLGRGFAGYRWNLTHFSFPFHLQHLTLNLGYNRLSLDSNSNLHARILFLRSPRSKSLFFSSCCCPPNNYQHWIRPHDKRNNIVVCDNISKVKANCLQNFNIQSKNY